MARKINFTRDKRGQSLTHRTAGKADKPQNMNGYVDDTNNSITSPSTQPASQLSDISTVDDKLDSSNISNVDENVLEFPKYNDQNDR